MKKYIFVIIGFVVMGLADARAETCVGENWNVSYSCGDGAQAGTLPDDQVATYGSEFTPVLLGTTHCTPPSGKAIAGIEVWVGDEYNDVYSATADPFLYYYASDVIIKPRYIGMADADSLWALRGVNGISHTYQAAAQTWQACLTRQFLHSAGSLISFAFSLHPNETLVCSVIRSRIYFTVTLGCTVPWSDELRIFSSSE